MKPYALITLSPVAFVREMDAVPRRVKPGYAVVPQAESADPAFAPATQKLSPTVTATETSVTYGTRVEPLTQAELDAARRESELATERNSINGWITAMKAGTATAKQTQRALAWVLRELSGK